MTTTAFVVVDLWTVKAGKRGELETLLAEAAPVFRSMPGVLSVDFAHRDNDPDRYLVVFRYSSEDAREALQQSEALRNVMARLQPLWDLDGSIVKGYPSGL
jgi:heme-degrading monooxygenase HmoA